MSLALESGVGLVGALIGFVFANGFESFLMWGAFFASGFFLFTHVTNLTQSLESRFPFLAKVVRIFLLKCFFSVHLDKLCHSLSSTLFIWLHGVWVWESWRSTDALSGQLWG